MLDDKLPRRRFLQSSAALGLGAGLGMSVAGITPARGEAMRLAPDAVRLRPEIEPVVRWIEETPRDKILEVAIGHLKDGLSYRELVAGLFLAGIRNIKPRPVGFKFHAVMVIHSAHIIGQTARVDERLLPMMWALDTFKASQATDVREGDWTLGAVDEAKLPSPSKAKAEFVKAMEEWDADAADVATAALCRSAGAADVMEPFWRYAIRDQRNIGHKAIFAAQSWRTLQAIGWPNAEPVLRSLAFGILDREGKSGRDAVGPYEPNLELLKTIRADWSGGTGDSAATSSLLAALRSASPENAAREVVNALNAGVGPGALWDAITIAGGELLLRKPGIVALHAVTSTNALHFIYGASGDEETRKLAMLQAASWTAMFRQAIGDAPALTLDTLKPVDTDGTGEEALGEIFKTIGTNRMTAAAKTLSYLANGGSAESLFAAGRRMLFHKGRDSHDYKYAAAAWEESVLASDPKCRTTLAAATMGHFPSSTEADSPLMIKAREAVANLTARS